MRLRILALALLLAAAPSLVQAASNVNDSTSSMRNVGDSYALSVPANDRDGAGVSLLMGTYRIRASGTYTFDANGGTADAEYIFTSAGSCIDLDDPTHYGEDGEGDPRYDLRDNVPGFSIRQWGTGCDATNHTYGPTRWPNVGVEDYTCTSLVCTATFWIEDPGSYADNVGALSVRFTKLS